MRFLLAVFGQRYGAVQRSCACLPENARAIDVAQYSACMTRVRDDGKELRVQKGIFFHQKSLSQYKIKPSPPLNVASVHLSQLSVSLLHVPELT